MTSNFMAVLLVGDIKLCEFFWDVVSACSNGVLVAIVALVYWGGNRVAMLIVVVVMLMVQMCVSC